MSQLLMPDGRVVETDRKEEHWPPEFMKMLAVFAMACNDHHLGIVCLQCQQPLSGQNARDDNFWHMECGCRKYIGRNPLPRDMRGSH